MTPSSISTPWPKDWPPHAIASVPSPHNEGPLQKMIENHLKVCEECQVWTQDHGDDWHQWVVDPGPLRTGYWNRRG